MSLLPKASPTPNYVDPPNRATAAVVYNVILITVVITVVTLRYASRLLVMKQRLGWDDFFIGLSLLCTLLLSITIIIADAGYGFSRHIWDIPIKYLPNILIFNFIAKVSFAIAATLTRTSVLCFYSRLVVNSGIRWFKYVLWMCHFFVAALCTAFVLPMIFQCRPFDAAWMIVKPANAQCINEGTVMLAGGIVNVVADALVTIIPIPLILRLKMPKHDQFGVLVLLSLGFFVTIAGIVRTYYIWLALVHSKDSSWFSHPLFIAAAVEVDVGIVCACAPTLRPLFSPYFKFLCNTIATTMKSTSNNTARRGSTSTLTGGSHHSHELSSNSRRTFSLSKQHIITNYQSLYSLDASTLRGTTPTPEPTYRPKSPNSKDEESDLATLGMSARLSARASLPRSVGSGASTLVQSNIAGPTGSVYYSGSQSSKKGSYERDEISVIKEVQVELESPERKDTPLATIDDAQRLPFKPFTTPSSPPLSTYAGNPQHTTIASSPNPDDDLSTWTRLPSLRFSRRFQPGTAIPAPNFSPYSPNLSHAQVASAAGYREGSTPDEERDVEKALGAEENDAADVGLAKSTFGMEGRDAETSYAESDRKYRSGRFSDCFLDGWIEEPRHRRGSEEEELVDVMQTFREERPSVPPRRAEIGKVGEGEVKKEKEKAWSGLGKKSEI